MSELLNNNGVNPMPILGEPAPEFTANTTQGTINFPSDFKGKWSILFSHPADFTPVCTTEFMAFGSMAQDFENLNCQLIGLSIDGLYSHIAWLRNIKEKIEYKGMKGVDIKFPLIDDISMNVAKLYGMIQPGLSTTATVRAVFFVDPKGILRTMLYYPLSLGRNFDEIKRILIGLQTADAFGVATPADWRPGDPVIDPTPATMDAVQNRVASEGENVTCHDWYLCTKTLSQDEIKEKLCHSDCCATRK